MTVSIINSQVKTPYGPGVVTAIDDNTGIHTIRLTAWVLSNDSPVHVYSTKSGFEVTTPEAETEAVPAAEADAVESVAAVASVEETVEAKTEESAEVKEDAVKAEEKPALVVGTDVNTVFGEGSIKSIDEERGIFHVQLTNWVLSGDSKVHVYCTVDNLKVKAPATTEATETPAVADVDTVPASDNLDTVDVPVTEEDATTPVTVGTAVLTAHGQGNVKNIREDGIYEIELTSWVLSGDSRVHVYCTEAYFVPAGSDAAAAAVAAKNSDEKQAKNGGCCVIF